MPDSLSAFFSTSAGSVAQWVGATIALFGLGFAIWQLHVLRKTNSGTFIHDLYKDFYTEDVSRLVPLLETDKLKIVKNDVFVDLTDKKRESFTEHEIASHLLDPLENLGALANRKLVEIGLVYDFFSWYIDLAWTNEEIRKLVERSRSEPDCWDLFMRLEKLYHRCKVYGDEERLRYDRGKLSVPGYHLANWSRALKYRSSHPGQS